MKALILNSGRGSRMEELTDTQPKCMTEIANNETILSRQLNQLSVAGITDVVVTTGYKSEKLMSYCNSLQFPLDITFIHNAQYNQTNYIYSIYCAREYLEDDIILMHGDLVFEYQVLDQLLAEKCSSMVVSTTTPLPKKDFKAVVRGNKIVGVGINFFQNAVSAQPLYRLQKPDWSIWLQSIISYCEQDKTYVYAEDAFNDVSEQCELKPLDIRGMLCDEVDTSEDLAVVSSRLHEINSRTVYMSFSTDILHNGHISLIKKAAKLGKVIVGVLTDQAVSSYKRFPLLPFTERKALFENITGVSKVVEQKTLSYRENLEKYHPTYVVHGDDWKEGIQRPVRDEVVSVLAEYGGILMEYPYADELIYKELERRVRIELGTPDIRRARLRKLLEIKGTITAMEAHSGLTGLIVEKTMVADERGAIHQFDAMWVSSLCDSTAKGKPDIELVDMSSRFRTIDDIMEVTTKPIIFDGDTGGLAEHFVYTVRTLERMGVSMVIVEDKTGLKKNSLFGTEVQQTQDDIEHFCAKISAGKRAQRTPDFMICARIESLILEQGMDDALLRAEAYVRAGADAIMIHSRRKDPAEIFEFVEQFRHKNSHTPIVVVPTSFSSVTEEEFKGRGVNIVIYANQLTRAGVPAMRRAAETILKYHRAQECDEICMPFKEIITLIPEE